MVTVIKAVLDVTVMEIIDYKIVHADSRSYSENQDIRWLTEKVKEYMSEGWVPFGGISTSCDSESKRFSYTQVMVKYDSQNA